MKFQTNNDTHDKPATFISPTFPATNSGAENWGATVRMAVDLLSNKSRENLANKQQKSNHHVQPLRNSAYPDQTPRSHEIHTEYANDSGDCIVSDLTSNNLSDPKNIIRALHVLAHQENLNLSTQLELLVRFDDLDGWRESGAKSCAAWISMHMQMDRRTAWERLRVGRQLRELPLISKLFQLGRLSWSKVRLLTRIATPENEHLLAHASTDATVNDVQRLCEEYRWPTIDDDESDAQQARMQWEHRSFTWQTLPDGNVHIKLILPPEQAQNFLHAINHCEDLIYHELESNDQTKHEGNSEYTEHQPKPSQRRADAAVLIAERSIALRGEHLSCADRFQVVLNVDHNSLSEAKHTNIDLNRVPTRKPTIEGLGAVPVTTARKLACDCSLVTLLSDAGEPLNIGRKQRIWTPALRRAILTRDRHCQFPGCTSHQFLQIHHIVHWADGGETSVDNGVCLCQFHHQLVHHEEYLVERTKVETNEFETTGLISASKKKLLPTTCRFVFKRSANTPNISTTLEPASSHQTPESPRGDWMHHQHKNENPASLSKVATTIDKNDVNIAHAAIRDGLNSRFSSHLFSSHLYEQA